VKAPDALKTHDAAKAHDPDVLRVGNASGFYGDRFDAMREMLTGGPLDDGGDNDGGGGGDATMCPSTQPTSGVTSCSGSERCEYGTESCCGNTYPSLVCECQSGTFYCYYTDACLIPGCPDAGDYAGVGEVCQAGELFDAGTAPRPCEPGLVCCYPCGIAGCDFRCIEPCTPGPGCQESGCPGPFP
jgi:hypothetical protein